jgi:hypothetical protein
MLAATGCGGGDSGNPTAGSGVSYSFAAPTVGAQATDAVTIVDNDGNTIKLTETNTVLSVNPDGSYVTLSEEPAGDTVVVNGTIYSRPPTTYFVDNAGQETSYSYTAPGTGEMVTCTFEPHGLGPDVPLHVGQTWTLEFTGQCGSAAPIMYTQSGSVVDVESVTVPAGTYMALKLQSTVTWTSPEGGMRTEMVTNWRNAVGLGSVRQAITYTYGAPLPTTGYPVSRQIVPQSISP